MNNETNVTFRLGTEEDSGLIVQLIYEMTDYEKLLNQTTIDEEKVRKSIINKEFETLFACLDDAIRNWVPNRNLTGYITVSHRRILTDWQRKTTITD